MKVGFMLFLALLILAGCSGTHMLPKGENCSTGAKVKLKKQGKITDKKSVEADVKSVLKTKAQ